jgi:hypothetical protein
MVLTFTVHVSRERVELLRVLGLREFLDSR